MDPVLIRTFPDRIAKEKAHLSSAVTAIQVIYSGFKALNITVTIAEITALVNKYISPEHRATVPTGTPSMLQMAAGIQPEPVEEKFIFLEEFAKDKLFPATKASFNGAPLKDEAIRAMVAVPDLSAIQTALKNYYQERGSSAANDFGKGLSAAQFKLTGDVVSKANTADADIEAKHTYYTRNDRGVNMANNLTALCTALNNYKTLAGSAMDAFTGSRYGKTTIEGVEYSDGDFIPSLDYIRKYEGI